MGDQFDDGRAGPDLPLLPRGTVVFSDLPARALVLEALAPAIGSGLLRVRSRHGDGFILLRDGALHQTHAFSAGGTHAGAHALDELRRWPDAQVSADRLDNALVDVCAALLQSDPLYEDLRLEWTSWSGLLADLARREAAYIVELATSHGRGVTCVAGGRQLLSYTDVDPALGDPALLDAMASSADGHVRVRRVPPMTFASLLQAGGGVPVPQVQAHRWGASFPAAVPQPAPPIKPKPAAIAEPEVELAAAAPAVPTPSLEEYAASFTAGHDTPPPEAAEPATAEEPDAGDLGWVAPWQVAWSGNAPDEPAVASSPLHRLTVADVHRELREIAQRRLQLSASRVELALDSAAAQDLPLDRVLEDLRSLSIRGVMQPTIEAMVDEMTEAAGRLSQR